jgi:hypothetical protein
VTDTLFKILNSHKFYSVDDHNIIVKDVDFFPEESSWTVEVYGVGVVGNETFMEKGNVALKIINGTLQGLDNHALEVAVIKIIENEVRRAALNELVALTEADYVPL